MKKKITNEDIYQKLVSIQKEIKRFSSKELFIEKEEIELEKKELNLLNKLHGRDSKKNFEDIIDWKREIWDNCSDKRKVSLKTRLDFICKKTEKTCRFIDCYRNKKK